MPYIHIANAHTGDKHGWNNRLFMMWYLSLWCIYPYAFSGNFKYQEINNELNDEELDRYIYYKIITSEVN